MGINIPDRVMQALAASRNPQYQALAAAAKADVRVPGGTGGVPVMEDMISGTLLAQYGLELPRQLIAKYYRENHILERIMAIQTETRPERAAVWGLVEPTEFSDANRGSFPIGGDPPPIKAGARSWQTKVKKSYGALDAVRIVDAVASGAAYYPKQEGDDYYANELARILDKTAKMTVAALEFAVVKGDEATYPTEFDGIEKMLTVDASRPFVRNFPTGFSVMGVLRQMIIEMMSYGIQPTELWMHPLLKEAIIDSYLGQSGYSISINHGVEQGALKLGRDANSIITPAGDLPIYTSYHFGLAGSGANLSGDIYIITAEHQGEPLWSWEWQIPLRALDLPPYIGYMTSEVVGSWCHGVMYEKTGGWAQGRLLNVPVTGLYQAPGMSPYGVTKP